MNKWIALLFFICFSENLHGAESKSPLLIVVVGAPGESEFEGRFQQWATNWKNLCRKTQVDFQDVGLSPTNQVADKEQFKSLLTTAATNSLLELWIVLIGHGTFDGKEAKFNLRGPDFSSMELLDWIKPIKCPIIVINTASSSGPFINHLSAPGRIIITGTNSGYEQNYTRFGQYFSECIGQPDADLDKDGQTSLLETFLIASRRVDEFFKVEGRLASEHALLDDNGDGLGTPADWFQGLRAVKKPKDAVLVDGARAHQFHLLKSPRELSLSSEQRIQRDALERKFMELREKKAQMNESQYYLELEHLLLELEPFYRQ